jgi:hypothetical protein
MERAFSFLRPPAGSRDHARITRPEFSSLDVCHPTLHHSPMSPLLHHLDLTVSDPIKSRPLYELFLGHCGFTLKSAGETWAGFGLDDKRYPCVTILKAKGPCPQARPLFARSASPSPARKEPRRCRRSLSQTEKVRRPHPRPTHRVRRVWQGLLRGLLCRP